MEKILTPQHEQKLEEIGSMIRAAETEVGGVGKRGWKSAACRLAIDYFYAQVKGGLTIPGAYEELAYLATLEAIVNDA